MRTIRLMLAVAALGAAGQARAQYYPAGALDGFVYGLMAADIGLGVSGLVTGTGSQLALLGPGEKNGWFKAAMVMGTVQLAMGGVFLYGAVGLAYGGQSLNPVMAGVALGHFAVGVWNLVTGTHGMTGWLGSWTPTVVQGRGASGRRFTGLGVQVAL